MEDQKEEKFLTATDLAQYLGLTTMTLYKYRKNGTGPKFINLGPKLIRYKKSDVDEWMGAKAVNNG